MATAFGRTLRRLRKASGLTQEGLGFEADVQRTYVSILELGQQVPSLATLFKLSNALHLPASEFVRMVETEFDLIDAGARELRNRS